MTTHVELRDVSANIIQYYTTSQRDINAAKIHQRKLLKQGIHSFIYRVTLTKIK